MPFLPPGTILGEYELLGGIGVGGMAELYLARLTSGDERPLVALKRLSPHFSGDPAFVDMFLDEARLTARLRHRNIVRVYGVGSAIEGLFFTMEFVHGVDVRTLLETCTERGMRVPLAQALAIVVQVANALQFAHDERDSDGTPLHIVHRDVSPSNVVVSFDGMAKLIDFGVAKANGRFARTRSGVVKGKVPYMSPEQCRGEEIDRRSDVFALGILLFELSTGKRPYKAANEMVALRMIADRDAPSPADAAPGYPEELETIVMRALARDPDRRYQSARELADDLVAFAQAHAHDLSPTATAGYLGEVFAEALERWRGFLAELDGEPVDPAEQPGAPTYEIVISEPPPRPRQRIVSAASDPAPTDPRMATTAGARRPRRFALTLAALTLAALALAASLGLAGTRANTTPRASPPATATELVDDRSISEVERHCDGPRDRQAHEADWPGLPEPPGADGDCRD